MSCQRLSGAWQWEEAEVGTQGTWPGDAGLGVTHGDPVHMLGALVCPMRAVLLLLSCTLSPLLLFK